MRLEILEHGHRLPAKVFQRIAALVFRDEMDDVAKAAMHRPGFFGRPLFDFGSRYCVGVVLDCPASASTWRCSVHG